MAFLGGRGERALSTGGTERARFSWRRGVEKAGMIFNGDLEGKKTGKLGSGQKKKKKACRWYNGKGAGSKRKTRSEGMGTCFRQAMVCPARRELVISSKGWGNHQRKGGLTWNRNWRGTLLGVKQRVEGVRTGKGKSRTPSGQAGATKKASPKVGASGLLVGSRTLCHVEGRQKQPECWRRRKGGR